MTPLTTHSLNTPFLGYAYHKIILDETGKPHDFIYLEVSPYFEALTGIPTNGIIGKRVREVIPGIENSEFDWIAFYGKIALEGGEAEIEQYEALLKRWFRIYAYSDKKFFFATFFIDITKQKENELELQKLTQAIEQNPACVVITDIQGNIEYVNPQFTQNTGYTKEEVKGKNPRILQSGKHPKEFYQQLWKTISSGNVWRGEFLNVKKSGELYYESATISPIFNDQHQIVNYVAIKEDITEKKIIEQELIKAKERAEEHERLKTAFLQNMSHEIRTPLNAISGFTQLLANPNITAEKRRNYGAIIQSNVHYLISIVTDILTMAALETGQEKIILSEVNINDLIIGLLHVFKQQTVNKPIAFYVTPSLNDNDAEIYTDRTKLNQILNNLLSNAIKFTDQGFIDFGYTLKTETTPWMLQFYVKDSGIGIAKENYEKIFERFHQADSSISRVYGGNGLGLAICKGLVELMGGKIWVESTAGKGSTFYFTIPYQPVNITKKSETNSHSTKKTILVAEDEEINYLLVVEFLNELNYNLVHAKNGKEAVEIAQNEPNIAIILMDIKMPEMPGDEAAQMIKSLHPNIPILAVSAYALNKERAKYENIFDGYLTKPLERDNFLNYITKFIEKDV